MPPEIFWNRNGRSSFLFKTLNRNPVLDFMQPSFLFKTLNRNPVLDFMQRLLLFLDVTHTHGLPEIVLKLGCLYFIESLQ